MAPIQPVWETAEPPPKPVFEESASEEDVLDDGDEDEEERETEAHVPVANKPAEVASPVKEAEKQLEALLADFGVGQKESYGQDESRGVAQDGASNGHAEKKDLGESKSSKKKKKKDKASKDAKESQDQTNNAAETSTEVAATEPTEEETSAVDVKERLKKVAAAKKKKSTKELDGAAKAAAH